MLSSQIQKIQFPTPPKPPPNFLGNLIDQNLTLVFWFFWAGKTFYTVMEAYKAYLRWDIVISNMWLAFPHIRWYTADEFPPIIKEIQSYHDKTATLSYWPDSYLFAHQLQRVKTKTRRFFILIDEGSIFFNARNFKKNFDNPDIIEFFVQPRKFDCSIAIICQNLEMIDVNFRRLAQEVVELRPWLFFRIWESYDTKYINFSEGWWSPDIPIKRRKFFVHFYYTLKSRLKFFWWLYYTKEILGERSIRSETHITTLEEYFKQEKENPDFHKWQDNFKLIKQQLFWLNEKEIKEDEENIKDDK